MNKREKLYKEANEFFLTQKAQEEGITQTPSGVLYRKLKSGTGTQFATPNSIVFVHYTGRLMDGTVIDSTEGEALPACFVVRELIMGWQIALTRMKQGDKMEIFIPWQHGYGKRRADNIPGYSTLVFELELVKLELR